MKEKSPELRDTEIAEGLLGSVAIPERTGGHEPDRDVLRSPLGEGEEAHVFCGGCGTHTPITAAGAETLADRANVQTKPDWTKNYIRVRQCIWCVDSFSGAEILPIP